jgi:5'-nucleotidase
MNAGGVRNPGFVAPGATPAYPYNITYGDAFTVQPFGNSLVTLTLTAQQIKDVLEQQFSGCRGQTVTRIMQIAASLNVQWSLSGSCDTRIQQVTFTPVDLSGGLPVVTAPAEQLVINGVLQSPSKTYRVTVNNFMATGGDGFTTFRAGVNPLGGAQDIDALVAYLSAFKAPAAPYDPGNPALLRPRITTRP